MGTKQFYTRKKQGKKFAYYYGDTRINSPVEIERINKLAIPPAWKNVQIAESSRAKVQAMGFDEAGRRQSIYHPSFRARQEALKFDRILRFAIALPKMRRQWARDLAHRKLDKPKVLACIVKLIDQTYIRVGNEKYAQENQSYGITTMRSKHLDIEGNTVTFEFVGKSGKEHVKKITDRQIANIIKQLDELPGYEVFRYQDEEGKIHDVHSTDVNEYIKTHMGEEFTAKDFRTWGGTLLATTEFLAIEHPSSRKARQKMIAKTVKRVAERLGNTPAIAKGSYIDPRVIKAFEHGSRIPKLRKAMSWMRPKRYMSIEEQCVLKLLS